MSTPLESLIFIPPEHAHRRWLLAFTKPVETVLRNERIMSVLPEEACRSVASILFNRLEAIAEPALTDMLLKEINTGFRIPVPSLKMVPMKELVNASAALWQKIQSSPAADPDSVFPLLRPKLETAAEYFTGALSEMLERILEHKHDISEAFLGCRDFGRITRIDSVNSDLHRRGRRTYVIHTRSGRFLYKPRDLRPDAWFRRLLSEYFPGIARIPECITYEGRFGFCEYIDSLPASSDNEAGLFYKRMGGLCAILSALGATDFHRGNFLASGSVPVPVDLEALIAPPFRDMLWDEWRAPGKRRQDSFCRSVLSSAFATCMLPRYLNGSELSPLTDISEYNTSAPVINGSRTTVFGYMQPFLTGLNEAYRLCIKLRPELQDMISSLPEARMRILFRDTAYYDELISRMNQPSCFRSKTAFEQGRSRLRAFLSHTPLDIPGMPRSAVHSEEAAILRGDIPLFYVSANGTDLLDENGETLRKNYFRRSPVSYALRKIAGLNKEEETFEESIIRQSMASAVIARKDTAHVSRTEYESDNPHELSVNEALQIAEEIFNRLYSRLLRAPGGTAGYCSLNYRLSFYPLQPGYRQGDTGIAVFCAAAALAFKGTETGKRAIELCDICLGTLRGAIRRYAIRKKPPDNIFRSVGISGLTGYIKAVMLVYQMLGREDDLELAREIAGLISEKYIRTESKPDLFSGLAGLITVICRFQEICDTERTNNIIRLCADRLLNMKTLEHNGRLLWSGYGKNRPLSGAGHGCAGIGHALALAARPSGSIAVMNAARDAFEFEHEAYSEALNGWPDLRTDPIPITALHGYCSGAPGIGAILLNQTGAGIDFAHSAEDLERALMCCLTHPLLERDHFCCGNCASVDFLLEYHRIRKSPGALKKAESLLSRMHERADAAKDFSYLPGQFQPVWLPNLYYGASGVGYEYLRYTDPERYPSLML